MIQFWSMLMHWHGHKVFQNISLLSLYLVATHKFPWHHTPPLSSWPVAHCSLGYSLRLTQKHSHTHDLIAGTFSPGFTLHLPITFPFPSGCINTESGLLVSLHPFRVHCLPLDKVASLAQLKHQLSPSELTVPLLVLDWCLWAYNWFQL